MKKLYLLLFILTVFSMFLSACQPADYESNTEQNSVIAIPNEISSIKLIKITEPMYYSPDLYKIVDNETNVFCYVARVSDAIAMQCFEEGN